MSFAVDRRPVLAIPSHFRSQNILQGNTELLHQKGYRGKGESFGGLTAGVRIVGLQCTSSVPVGKSLTC